MFFRTTSTFVALFASALAAGAVACSQGDSSTEVDEGRTEAAKDLYEETKVLDVRVQAPVSTLFERFKANKADPPKPVEDGGAPIGFQEPEYSEAGKLVITQNGTEKSLDMRIYVRGESSKNDCPFTKLKVDFTDKDQLKGTPFKGHGKFRLNTHCGPGDASARSGMGRVMNGVGPVREDVVYKILVAAGIPTYKTRVLHVVYEDSAANTKTDTFGMAIESGDDAAQRFVKEKLLPTDAVYLDPKKGEVTGKLSDAARAQITVAEAFSGNKDFAVDSNHNVDCFGIPKGADVLKIAADFDLGAVVLADIARYWKGSATIPEAKPGLTNADAVKGYLAHKAAMYAALDRAEQDAIDAKVFVVKDGKTDPGFAEARKRLDDLFALPELSGGAGPAVGDAGADAADAK